MTATDTEAMPTTANAQLAQAFRETMTDKRLSIEDVAARLPSTYSYVQRRVSGTVPMTVDDAVGLGRVIGVDIAPYVARRRDPRVRDTKGPAKRARRAE
jgi:hypothetical protein